MGSVNVNHNEYAANSQKKEFLLKELMDLAQSNYSFSKSASLYTVLNEFIFSSREVSQPDVQFSLKGLAVGYSVFKEEYLFTREVLTAVNCLKVGHFREIERQKLFQLVIGANYHLESPHISYGLIELVNRLMDKISSALNLTERQLLLMNQPMVNHVKFLAIRMMKNEVDSLPAVDDIYFHIAEKHPDSFAIAIQLRHYIFETDGFALSNNEVSYLALHLNKAMLALERS